MKPDVEVAAEQALSTAHLAAVKRVLSASKDAEVREALVKLVGELQGKLKGGAR